MRLLFWTLCFSLLVTLTWFGVSNAGTVVSVKVGSKVFETPISLLVGVSLVLGVVVTAIIAIAEGARGRFENRRLAREVRQLETEIHYLRTQPATSPPPEADTGPAAVLTAEPALSPKPLPAAEPASAPVYGDDEEDWTDPEPYRGGGSRG